MPPKRCSHFDGAIRNAATSVPTTMAIANATTTSRTVTQKPERNSGQYSVSTSSKLVLLHQLHGLCDRDRRRLTLLTGVLADPGVEELVPLAVVLELLAPAVDELDHLGLALLDAGAVGLLREFLA